MTETQVQYASVIHSSGNDLLELLNSILDLAKAESGTVTVDVTSLSMGELRTGLLREFEHVANAQGLGYSVDLAPDCPAHDRHRPAATPPDPEEPDLERVQVHRARPGRHCGSVWPTVDGARPPSRWRTPRRSSPSRSTDTGIGIDDAAAAPDLRSVRAGRRHHRPALRRHRARPLDQPGARRAARRRDHRVQHSGSRAARSPSTCPRICPPSIATRSRRRRSSAPVR